MATHVSATIYGDIEGNPPFQDAAGHSSFSRVKPYPSPLSQSFPTANVDFWALPNGYRMPAGQYVYSVIRELPTGLNVHGNQYVTDVSVATLATNAS